MKLHLVTIGSPKLAYAQLGWEEYLKRLMHYHQVRVSHIADKNNNATAISSAIDNAYLVALVIEGTQLTSPDLAKFLERQALTGREVCFVIGGPEGLPNELIERADLRLSFSMLTFPHDLAMVILVESLYRASTISAGQPYHK
jgi:23S rRNA (pseudouridine1915-N3)-methyltransferase